MNLRNSFIIQKQHVFYADREKMANIFLVLIGLFVISGNVRGFSPYFITKLNNFTLFLLFIIVGVDIEIYTELSSILRDGRAVDALNLIFKRTATLLS